MDLHKVLFTVIAAQPALLTATISECLKPLRDVSVRSLSLDDDLDLKLGLREVAIIDFTALTTPSVRTRGLELAERHLSLALLSPDMLAKGEGQGLCGECLPWPGRTQELAKPMLRAVLYLIRAELAHEQGHLQPAAEAFAEAVDELHALHLDIDHKRIYAMLHFGLTLLAQGNKRDAEKLFLDVLSYPWFLVMESDVQALLRDYYVKAALGLIECRRGDLAALEEIFFVPATHDELLPYLQRAIEEAGGRLNR